MNWGEVTKKVRKEVLFFFEKKNQKAFLIVGINKIRANTPRIILNYCPRFDWRAQQTHLAVLQPHFASKNGGLPIAVKTTHNDFLVASKI